MAGRSTVPAEGVDVLAHGSVAQGGHRLVQGPSLLLEPVQPVLVGLLFPGDDLRQLGHPALEFVLHTLEFPVHFRLVWSEINQAAHPAMRVIVGWRAFERPTASTNTMSRFETETLALGALFGRSQFDIGNSG